MIIFLKIFGIILKGIIQNWKIILILVLICSNFVFYSFLKKSNAQNKDLIQKLESCQKNNAHILATLNKTIEAQAKAKANKENLTTAILSGNKQEVQKVLQNVCIEWNKDAKK